MSLTSFRVTAQKSIVLAEAKTVPKVMVIAGPNGVGKSTLLFAIKSGSGQNTPNTRLFYQGPHRVLRRTNVRRSWLGGSMRWMLDLLSGSDVSGYEGLNFQNPARTPDNVDEAGSTIKHTLGKIENRRQSTLAGLVDARKTAGVVLDVRALPDIYEPLRTLTKYLLPHLEFSKVDFNNEDDIKCLWTRKDANRVIELDIDDLSSGEKSIVVLFLPLLEDQIRAKLQVLTDMSTGAVPTAVAAEDRVVLIDEPEQHLHPDLQSKILTYIRSVSRDSNVQFVLTTHSPSILDQAFDDELYVLSEPSTTPGENQLRRIAGNAERLEALKELAGSTYFLTTGRAIVCIEGEPNLQDDELTDARLLELMYPRSTAVTLVPTRGKGNVITTVQRLREHVPEDVFRIRVRGLVDADQAEVNVPGIETLPVCMIENLLLDEQVLYEYLVSIGSTTHADAAAVKAELVTIAGAMVDDEVALRIRHRIGGFTVRIAGASIMSIRASHEHNAEKLRQLLPDDATMQQIVTEVSTEVQTLLTDGKAMDRFRGKAILKHFYERHVAPRNISYAQAGLEIAKRVGEKPQVAARLDPVFDRLVA